MARSTIALTAALAALLAGAGGGAVLASEPVPREIVGCVVNGVFRGEDYVYRLRVSAPRESRAVDLTAFEGMTLRIGGALLPGDTLMLRTLEVVASTCRRGAK